MDGPIALANHEARHLMDTLTRDVLNRTLIYRAELRHAAAPGDMDLAAHRLTVRRHQRQLWRLAGGDLVLCVWVWLSDGYKARSSLRVSGEDSTGGRTWCGIEWPLGGC